MPEMFPLRPLLAGWVDRQHAQVIACRIEANRALQGQLGGRRLIAAKWTHQSQSVSQRRRLQSIATGWGYTRIRGAQIVTRDAQGLAPRIRPFVVSALRPHHESWGNSRSPSASSVCSSRHSARS